MMRKAVYTCVFLLGLVSSGFALDINFFEPEESSWLYAQARAEARRGNYDFAFLHFHALASEFPDSKYLEKSLFAIGEYHYLEKNYPEATTAFLQLITDYPKAPSTLFAMCYLMKIAQERQDSVIIPELEKGIATFHQLSLVFRNSKEFSYESALLRKHKVIYYIDKVEFFINGDLFAQIPY